MPHETAHLGGGQSVCAAHTAAGPPHSTGSVASFLDHNLESCISSSRGLSLRNLHTGTVLAEDSSGVWILFY